MYGLIVKLTAGLGKREELMALLRESAAGMPGCLSYVVAKDAADQNLVWVTELWESQASHDSSLFLPQVKQAIPRSRALVANFEKIAVTEPVWSSSD